MSVDDDIIRIIAKFEGEEEAKRLAAATALAEQKFKALYASLGAGDPQTRAAAASLGSLERQLATAQSATKGYGQAMMQAGYAVDDLQYGFKGIANNIQPILQSIPALAGIAPVLSIAAIAAYQLYDHWDELAGLFGMGATKTQAEEMEELGKKTAKTAEETERLAKWEERRKVIASQQGDKTQAQSSAQKAAHEAIVEAPYSNVRGAVEKMNGVAVRNSGPQEAIEAKKAADKQVAALQEQLKQPDLALEMGGSSRQEVQESYEAAVKKSSEAQKKLDDDYNAKINAMVADLELDSAKMKAFLDKIEKDHSILGGTANTRKFQDAVKEGSKTPEEKEDEKQQEIERKQQEDWNARRIKANADSENERTKEMSKPLQERYNALEASGRTPDRAGVKQELMKGGATEEEAEKLVDAVLQALQEGFVDAIRKKAGAKGLDDAGAKAAIVKDYSDKQKAEKDKAEKDAVEKADKAEAGTGFNARSHEAFVRYALNSGGLDKVDKKAIEQQFSREFQEKGLGREEADLAAHKKVSDLVNSVGDRVAGMGMQGPPKMPPPERIASADFARSVEASGAKEMKSIAESTAAMEKSLADIKRHVERGPRLV
jgi:hypothetical protein